MLIDSHCHLDFPDFDEDRDAVVESALASGIERIVTICTRVRQFERICTIAETYDSVYCSVGTHPHNAHEELDITAEALCRYAEHPKVVAIGEAGLDYYYDNSPREAQIQGLKTHIEAARLSGLPLVIHARAADEDMIAILESETDKGSFPAVLHCFSSGLELAKRAIKLGHFVSFSGILTFKKSVELREIAMQLPLDRLLVETDAPYLAPMPHRGKRNEPVFVHHTARQLAETLDLSQEALIVSMRDNFYRLFSKVPKPKVA